LHNAFRCSDSALQVSALTREAFENLLACLLADFLV